MTALSSGTVTIGVGHQDHYDLRVASNVADLPEDKSYQHLVEGIANGALAFVGAGASRMLGYPTWNPLLDRLHQLCADLGVDASELEAIKATDALLRAHLYQNHLTRQRLLDELVKLFNVGEQKTSTFHKALVAVGFDHLLTTNYDLGIETSHNVEGIATTSIDLTQKESVQFVRAASSRRGIQKTVLHVHGRVDNANSIVLALRDYREVYNLNASSQSVLGNLLFSKSFVFIGYSLSDPPLNAILDQVASINGDSDRPQHWAILPRSPDAAAKRLHLKHNFNIEPVFYDVVDGSHAALIPLIEKLARDVNAFRDREGLLVGANVIDAVFGPNAGAVTRQQAEERLRTLSTVRNSVNVTAITIPDGGDRKTPLDLRIDAHVELMKAGLFEKARENFEALLKELPVEAEPRLFYRLHANIGHCLFQLDRRIETASHYEIAYAKCPDFKDAMWMHAFAAELRDDLAEAVVRAEALCKAHPDFARGYTVWIRSANQSTSLRTLKRYAPRIVRRDAEVAAALAEAADKRQNWRVAEGYARQAVKAGEEWESAYMIAGIAILKGEMGGDQPAMDHQVVPLSIERINEAVRLFSKSIEILTGKQVPHQTALAYLNRAGAYRLLGDDNAAHRDVLEAYRLDSADVRVITKYAHDLEVTDKLDEAIDAIEASPDAMKFFPARMFRAISLFRRKKGEDLIKAEAEAISLIAEAGSDEVHTADAHGVLCNVYLAQGYPEKAIDHLRAIEPSALSPGLRDARLASMLSRDRSLSDEITTLLTSAVVAARSVSPWFARREIAHICTRLRRFRDAADILATIISPKRFSEESEEYLGCLFKSQQFGPVREYCKALRTNGQYTQGALHAECDALLALDESREAIEVLSDWLAWRPDDKTARLYLAAMHVQRSEPELVTFDLKLLPNIDELRSPREGIHVIKVLSHGPDPKAAVEYAYRLNRKYPNDEQIQFALISALLTQKSDGDLATTAPVHIAAGHAVSLKSLKGDTTRVVKLVDDTARNADEYHISHELSQALMGKKAGEEVKVGTEQMTIVSVAPMAALAAKDALDDFNLRFPQSRLIQKFNVPDAPADPSNPKDVMGEEWWQMAMADDQADTIASDLHQKGKLPLAMLARRRGRSLFQTALHVWNSSDMEVLSAPEIQTFAEASIHEASRRKAVVLDSTVLATLVLFDMSDLLRELPFDFIVPDTALQEVRTAKHEAETGFGSVRAGLSNGKFFMSEVSTDAMKAWAARLEKLLLDVQSTARVLGGAARERVTFPDKEKIAKRLNESAFDSIAIAIEQNAIVWTDDQMFGRVARDLCGVSSIWTQALLHIAGNKAGKRWRGRYLPELLNFKFRNTTIFVHDVALSLQRTRWKLNHPLVNGLRENLRAHGCTPSNYAVTQMLFVAMWTIARKRDRRKVIIAIHDILSLYDRAIVRRFIARPLYRPHKIPYRKATPAFRQLRHVFRTWASQPPQLTDVTRTP